MPPHAPPASDSGGEPGSRGRASPGARSFQETQQRVRGYLPARLSLSPAASAPGEPKQAGLGSGKAEGLPRPGSSTLTRARLQQPLTCHRRDVWTRCAFSVSCSDAAGERGRAGRGVRRGSRAGPGERLGWAGWGGACVVLTNGLAASPWGGGGDESPLQSG